METSNETLESIRPVSCEQTLLEGYTNMDPPTMLTAPRTRRRYQDTIQAALSDVSKSGDVHALSLGRARTERTALRKLTTALSQSDIAAVRYAEGGTSLKRPFRDCQVNEPSIDNICLVAVLEASNFPARNKCTAVSLCNQAIRLAAEKHLKESVGMWLKANKTIREVPKAFRDATICEGDGWIQMRERH